MPRAAKNLEGQRFGRLLVGVRDTDNQNKSAYWHVACDCGTQKVVRGSQMTSGGTISCGCYAKEHPPGGRNFKHGMSNTFEFSAWTAMQKRCYSPAHKAYAQYGGRGIKVCERWKDFVNFYADMGKCPFPKGSIERQDVDGNYTPHNCVWLPRRLQSANRRVVLKSRERQSQLLLEVEALHELIGSLYKKLSGKIAHASYCATNSAPAHLPGPCNCKQ